MKIKVNGLKKGYDRISYEYLEGKDFVGIVHIMDLGFGDGERTLCGIDTVSGLQYEPSGEKVTCKDCIRVVKYIKSVDMDGAQ